MKKWEAVATFILIGVLASAAWSADTLVSVRQKGTLVAGVKNDAPPFGFRDPATGEIVGLEVDLVRAVAKKLKVKLALRPVSSVNRIPDLIDGKVDIVAATMIKTADRAKVVDFSNDYFRVSQRILARKGTIASLKDLEGKKIGVVSASSSERNIRALLPSAKPVAFTEYREAVDALEKGEIDALSGMGVFLYGRLARLGPDKYEIPPAIRIAEEKYGMAVRKGDKGLLKVVNATLAELSAGGETQRIFDRWLQRRSPDGTPASASRGPQAVGAITRLTSTEGRFAVQAIAGSFRAGADVGIYDREGEPVGRGTIQSVYGDEVYVDADRAPAGVIDSGFAVAMNYGDADAKKFILTRKDIYRNIKEEARDEEAQMQREIAKEHKEDESRRERWQEDMTKTKMMLDYEYSDYYYYHGYPYHW